MGKDLQLIYTAVMVLILCHVSDLHQLNLAPLRYINAMNSSFSQHVKEIDRFCRDGGI